MGKNYKAPAFQFYPGDRVQELVPIMQDDEAMAAWIRVVIYLWGAGPTPAQILSSVAGKGWVKVGFLLNESEGLFSLGWMEERRAAMKEFSARQAENGKRGGRPKSRSSKGENPSLSSGLPKPNPNQSSSARKNEEEDSITTSRKERARELVWPPFAGEKCKAKWADFLAYRAKEHGKRYKTIESEQRQLNRAAKYFPNGPAFVDGLEETMDRNWQFPVDPAEHKYSSPSAPKPTLKEWLI